VILFLVDLETDPPKLASTLEIFEKPKMPLTSECISVVTVSSSVLDLCNLYPTVVVTLYIAAGSSLERSVKSMAFIISRNGFSPFFVMLVMIAHVKLR